MLRIRGGLGEALRATRRRPGVSALAALIVAVAVGVAAAGAEIADRVLLRPLAYPQPERLAVVWSSLPELPRAPLSGPELRDLRQRVPAFAAVGAVWTTSATLLEGGRPEPIRVALATGNLLPLLGVRPALGRLLAASDGGSGSDPVLVLGGGLWRRRFGGAASVLGRSLRLDGGWGFSGGRFTAVGALSGDFRLTLPPEAGLAAEPDVWIAWPDDVLDGPRALYYLRVLARLAPGASAQDAQNQLESLDSQLVAEYPEYEGEVRGLFARPLGDEVSRGLRPAATLLLGGAALLLAIAAFDAAGLALARAVDRRRELATRIALGGSGGQIAGMLLVEAALPAVAGGAVGALLAHAAAGALRAAVPAEALAGGGPGLGRLALSVAAAVALVTAVASVVAALAGARAGALAVLLTGRERAVTPAGGSVRRALVVGQAALSALLLAGAGLAARSFAALLDVDPGFRAAGVLAFRVDLPPGRYPGPAEIDAFDRALEERLAGLPGVAAVGATSHLPFDTLPNWTTRCRWVGDTRPDTAFEADARAVSGGYLESARLRLRRGRFVDASDTADAAPAVVVDERLAATAPGGLDPLGAAIEVFLWGGRERGFHAVRARVVGVVTHARHSDLRREVRPQVYAALSQSGRNQLGLLLRADVDPATLARAVRAELTALDPDLALAGPRPLDDYLDVARGPERAAALVSGGFALASLLLASTGVYGVLAHVVSRRRREIGLRLALGAAPAGLRRLVLLEGLRLTAVGLAAGMAAALLAARLAGSLLYDVSPADPMAFGAAAVVLAGAAFAAAWGPAGRATRVDPVECLHEE